MEEEINYQYEEMPEDVEEVLNEIYVKGGEYNEK